MHARTTIFSMLRDATIVAIVAVLTVQSLRKWYGDRYLVPSDSMQPVLFGDPEEGDVVFVDKLASASDQRRGDLVVVADKHQPDHQLVKRIAARGDDPSESFIDIIGGDVYLGANRQQMVRVEKDPLAAMARSVSWGALPGTDDARAVIDMRSVTDGGPWTLPPMGETLADVRASYGPRPRRARHRDPSDGLIPPGAIGSNRPVDCSFLDIRGARSLNGDSKTVVDCGMTLKFAELPSLVLCTIESLEWAVTFIWDAQQRRVTVWNNARGGDGKVFDEIEWRGEMTFGRLDGRDFLLLDGKQVMLQPMPARLLSSPPRRSYVYVAHVGKQVATIESLRVFRDVFAWRQPELDVPGGPSKWPVYVPKGQWFLLGDNAFDSRDSRQFGPVEASSFLGVPSCVLGPWSRRRWIAP